MAIVTTLVSSTSKTTAQSIIERALRLIGVYSSDSPLTAEDVVTSLVALNSMLGMWSNERLMVYVPTLNQVALTPGKSAYTIGDGGEIDTTRPTDIDGATYVQSGDISYPLQVLTSQEYNSIEFKPLQSTIPQAIWYLKTYPLGQITIYGTPSDGMTLNLWSWKPFTEFAVSTDEVILPPGTAEALAFNLAVSIAPEYEKEATPTVKSRAVMSKKLLKRTNLEVPVLGFPAAVQPSGRFSIYSGL